MKNKLYVNYISEAFGFFIVKYLLCLCGLSANSEKVCVSSGPVTSTWTIWPSWGIVWKLKKVPVSSLISIRSNCSPRRASASVEYKVADRPLNEQVEQTTTLPLILVLVITEMILSCWRPKYAWNYSQIVTFEGGELNIFNVSLFDLNLTDRGWNEKLFWFDTDWISASLCEANYFEIALLIRNSLFELIGTVAQANSWKRY